MIDINLNFMRILKLIFQKEHLQKKVSLGKKFYEKNSTLINNVENEFNIERELLLALMGIELILELMLVKWIYYHLWQL